eukprot:gene8391-biopygen21150
MSGVGAPAVRPRTCRQEAPPPVCPCICLGLGPQLCGPAPRREATCGPPGPPYMSGVGAPAIRPRTPRREATLYPPSMYGVGPPSMRPRNRCPRAPRRVIRPRPSPPPICPGLGPRLYGPENGPRQRPRVYVWGWAPSCTAPPHTPGGDDPPIRPPYVRGWAPGYTAPHPWPVG